MKHSMMGLLAVAMTSQVAFAAFSPDEMYTATKAAVEDFMKANPNHAEHFTGYKVWKSGDDVKAKVYVNHAGMNMEYNYVCHKHPGKIECHYQP